MRGGDAAGNRTSVASQDNTPPGNPVTNAGATLGRVLFYDRKLSANGTVSCGSCHLQGKGFSDPQPLSEGFQGGLTGRNSMGLANLRFHQPARFFWDERAPTLEAQVLEPFQDPVEMGLSLDSLLRLVRQQPYYPALFEAAFGSPEVDADRVSRALAQFVRSLVSINSKYDRGRAMVSSARDSFPNFTAQENRGKSLFISGGGGGRTPCTDCHTGEAMISFGNAARGRRAATGATSNGLDSFVGRDRGLAATTGRNGDAGWFKSPSLRNVAQTAPYMHDGRFQNLDEVVEHYSTGIKSHPNLARDLQARGGAPQQYEFTSGEKADLIAFLRTLSDDTLLVAERFSDPFADPVAPRIDSVTNSASGQTAIAGQTWITITGRNLAGPPDSGDVTAPVSPDTAALGDGTRVLIQGESVPTATLTPKSVRALVPAIAEGEPIQIQIATSHGISPLVEISTQPLAPALFSIARNLGTGVDWSNPDIDAFAANGTPSGYVAAVRTDWPAEGTSRSLAVTADNPVTPGERISLFGTGFGITGPGSENVTVWFDGIVSTVSLAASVAPGIYRIDLIVPAFDGGDAVVDVEIGGIRSQPAAFVPIAQEATPELQP